MAKPKKANIAKKEIEVSSGTRVSQSDFPSMGLTHALRIPQALWDNFAGKGAAPHEVALSIEMTPTSGPWRMLCGAAVAYGLTDGGYNATEIKLTNLGKRIVAPEQDGDDFKAKAEAVLTPRIMGSFFKEYDKAKFPQDNIAQNVLIRLGLPKDRAVDALAALKEAGNLSGILRDTKTGPFVSVTLPAKIAKSGDPQDEDQQDADDADDQAPGRPAVVEVVKAVGANANRVFISHGKSKAITDQLKELLVFGKLEPVVSVERESTAIPVPDKVFDDMRSCGAGVIHVRSEGELLDQSGNKHIHLNHNVLIEIGAAMALYSKRVILLVEKGVTLPSNLQGLYRCDYEGERLDYEATMKLLKTFNEFK